MSIPSYPVICLNDWQIKKEKNKIRQEQRQKENKIVRRQRTHKKGSKYCVGIMGEGRQVDQHRGVKTLEAQK
jgi:hypothetical protein